MKTTRLLIALFALICASCDCPLDDLDRAHLRKKNTGNEFCAEDLIGTWQCSYKMIIGGMEFKQIKFM